MPGGCTTEAGRFKALPTLQCYDLVAGRWDTGCVPMTQARSYLGVAALHGEIWAEGGGWWDAREGLHALASVEMVQC